MIQNSEHNLILDENKRIYQKKKSTAIRVKSFLLSIFDINKT